MPRRDPLPVAGRVVAVTGGARGIGRATAAALAARGARVAIGDLDLEAAQEAAAEIGRGTLGLGLDVARRASFTAFLASAEDGLGAVDVLVNNAGVLHVGPFAEEHDDWTRRQVDINLHGVILGMKLALPEMVARRSGHVLNVASLSARVGIPGEAVYSATKWAVAGLTDAVRRELRGTGVELSVVLPGVVRTELAAGTARRGRTLTPEAVATAIVATIERPRPEVVLPGRAGLVLSAVAALPRPARDAALRALGAERVTRGTTPEDRRAYEERIEALTAHELHEPHPPATAGGLEPHA